MPASNRELPVIAFASAADWEAWLDAEAARAKGVWLKFPRAASGIAGVSKQEAIDAALCHGWIDGQVRSLDADHWLLRFTPRAPKGKWSQINRERATALIALGRMRPAGLRAVDKARRDGRWEAAYAPQRTAAVPDDLQAALDGTPAARRMFEGLDGRNRYAILHRVHIAKKPETRAARIAKFVAMLARGETIYPRP